MDKEKDRLLVVYESNYSKYLKKAWNSGYPNDCQVGGQEPRRRHGVFFSPTNIGKKRLRDEPKPDARII